MVQADVLVRLAEESAKLNNLTDNLNVLIKETENKIYKASPGFAFFGKALCIADDRWKKEKNTDAIYRIGWCKHAHKEDTKVKWQLVLIWEYAVDPEDLEEYKYSTHTDFRRVHVVRPIVECNREIRLLAYDYLSEFISDLTEEIERRVDQISDLSEKHSSEKLLEPTKASILDFAIQSEDKPKTIPYNIGAKVEFMGIDVE